MNDFNKNFRRQNTPMVAGVVLVGFGLLILAHQLGLYLPSWLFSWQTILIGVGIYLGSKRNFQAPYGWAIPIAIGGLSILGHYIDFDFTRFIFPIIIIAAGLVIILNANHTPKWIKEWKDEKDNAKNKYEEAEIISDSHTNFNTGSTFASAEPQADTTKKSATNGDDYINATAIFGGIKKNISSKFFKGGDIVTIMGGCEINLLQADMQSPAILDMTQIMGGARLLVPAHWEIKSEIVAFMGGIEDKRPSVPNYNVDRKILILKGTTIMGGIDIRSY